ncbi:Nucleoside-triphosphatase rdgB [Alkalidesulfovibrio alkalitolerans DSM 16529]|uniref:dITP/XTP pyrophosphatase n=1 Tax=Alkalidesulfovibrio alkalitolerans DSM 16529 TaxID=1121439 RepID=S7T7F3_9BACT|nr:XTP/dITP diphosphatase [Alkalidesulfovibrio alkalitolerans]EPR32420.1 Nucleoside-triphosphatase rdgB [Alkalidesulfovibrio alkalitolerans DSM 16529]
MSNEIVLATRNQGKITELAELLKGTGLAVLGLDAFPGAPEVEETGETFEDNALLKARAIAAFTGITAVADDSGLAVDALSGAPGVRSARYAGEDATDATNNARLLRELSGVPLEKRTARFVCVMAAVSPSGDEVVVRGEWEGRVADQARGEGGFGYDPLFVDPVDGRHAAELPRDEKNRRSHRGAAMRALLSCWPDFWKSAKRD